MVLPGGMVRAMSRTPPFEFGHAVEIEHVGKVVQLACSNSTIPSMLPALAGGGADEEIVRRCAGGRGLLFIAHRQLPK
jgi:hypothetical protein